MRRLAVLLLPLSTAACREARFEHASVWVDAERGDVSLVVSADAGPPCPEVPSNTEIHFGGMPGTIDSFGGEDCDPGGCHDRCRDIRAAWGVRLGEVIDVTVQSLDPRTDIEIRADWPGDELAISTDDDLEAAAATGGTFTVHWGPDDAVLADLQVDEWTSEWQRLHLIELSRGPGTATFQFDGEVTGWHVGVVGALSLERAATICEGIDDCSVRGDLEFDLNPYSPPPTPEW